MAALPQVLLESQGEGEFAEGQHWPGTNISWAFWLSVLNRVVQDSLLVCHGPHIVLSSVLDPCVRDFVVEYEQELLILPVAVKGWTQRPRSII